jgi:hypothetical protein
LGGLRHGGSGKGGKSGLYRAASVPEQGNFLSSHILWARQRAPISMIDAPHIAKMV